MSTTSARPRASAWTMYSIRLSEPRTVTNRLADRVGAVRRDDDDDVLHAGGREVFEDVEDDRLVRERDQLLRQRVASGAAAGSHGPRRRRDRAWSRVAAAWSARRPSWPDRPRCAALWKSGSASRRVHQDDGLAAQLAPNARDAERLELIGPSAGRSTRTGRDRRAGRTGRPSTFFANARARLVHANGIREHGRLPDLRP